VRSFERQGEVALGSAIKRDSEFEQVADAMGSVLRDQAGDNRIDNAGACGDRVEGVQGWFVFWRQRRCEAALRPC
jgi:hypothetical protein